MAATSVDRWRWAPRNLYRLRRERGMSMETLARKLGEVTMSTVKRWEEDVCPKLNLAFQIAETLRVPIWDLLEREPIRSSKKP